MSTPNSRGGKSEGFSLYAPRRVLPPDGEPRSERMRHPESQMPRRHDDWTEAGADWQAVPDDRESDPDRDRLEQAIREVFEPGSPAAGTGDIEEDAAGEVERYEEAYASPAEHQFEERQDWDEPESGRHDESQTGGRLRSLDPDIVPAPPPEMLRNGAGRLVRLSVVVAIAAIVAYGVTTLWTWQSGDAGTDARSDRIASTASPSPAPPVQHALPVEPVPLPSRLAAVDQQVFADEPLALAVAVEHPRQGETLVFRGLVPGTRLSAGASTGAASWRLSPSELKGLFLYPPKGFVGVMNTAVDLIGADQQLLDSRIVQLRWIPKQTDPAPVAVLPPAAARPPEVAPPSAAAPAPPRLAPPVTTAQTPAAAKPAAPAVVASTENKAIAGAPRPTAAAVNALDPGEVDFLMQEGRRAMSGGDISAARVAFRRLADAGNAEATLALGETYDPLYLAQHNVIGLSGDRAAAKDWYEKAKELGSREADGLLARLGDN